MKKVVTILFLAFLLMQCSNVPESNYNNVEEIKKELNQLSSQHPRLYLGEQKLAQIKNNIENNELLKKGLANLKNTAENYIENPIDKEREGKRLKTNCLERVGALAFLYRYTNKQKYFEAAKKDMLTISNWDNWNPSHFLDAADAAVALGLGYDWLYNKLTKEERQTIKNAIIEKAFKPSFEGQWWIYARNNWNSVCHGSLTLAALSIFDKENELPKKVIIRALNAIPIALKEYSPDGAYPEGPGYWNYGTEFSVIMISALESALGTDFGLKSIEGFMKSSEYILHAKGPTNYYFNYSDNSTGEWSLTPPIFWLQSQLNKPELFWYQKPILRHEINKGESISPFIFIWHEGRLRKTKPEKLNWMGEGRTPVSFHRSGWNDEATYIGIKGGSPGTNHAHMDIGTFVIDALGERWAMDPGGEEYYKLESAGLSIWNMHQSSDRWKVFRYNNFSHNTLVVDSSLQRVYAKGKIVNRSTDPDFSYTIIDMSKTYQGLIGNNATVRRGMGLYKDGSVLIQDEITGEEWQYKGKEGTNIRWNMLTRAKVEVKDNNTAILKKDGKKMGFHILSPNNSKIKLVNTQNPAHKYDSPIKESRMITFDTKMQPNENIRLIVYLHPKGLAENTPEIKSLYDWQEW